MNESFRSRTHLTEINADHRFEIEQIDQDVRQLVNAIGLDRPNLRPEFEQKLDAELVERVVLLRTITDISGNTVEPMTVGL